MDLDSLSVLSGIINDFASTMAFVVGGVWFCWKFIYMRMGAWNLKMTVTSEVIQTQDSQHLLNINVSLMNDGNTKITPGPKGCIITVRRLNSLTALNSEKALNSLPALNSETPQNSETAQNSVNTLSSAATLNSVTTPDKVLDLNSGEVLIENYDILNQYKRPGIGYKNYEIEPHSEYHEVAILKVSQGDILSIRTEFFWKDNKDSITEYSIRYVE